MAVKLLTKTTVEGTPYTGEKVLIVYDTRLKGFGLRVSGSAKAYFAEAKVNGKTRRVKIGTHEKGLSTEEARRMAQALLTDMHAGIDPNAKKREAREHEAITLRRCFNDYLARGTLKPKTRYDYELVFKNCFSAWADRPLTDVSKEAVLRRFRVIGEERGPAYANLAFRLLRALYGYAEARYDGITENPVLVLSKTRAWNKIERRRTVIKPHELPAFFGGLTKLRGESPLGAVAADYISVLLFTGLRRQEAAGMKSKDVDFKAKNFTITQTKNGQPHTLPMSEPLLEIFRRRQIAAGKNEYVFSVEGIDRPLTDPRNELERVQELSGVIFGYHDLRRSFATIAEAEVSGYQLKRMLNHSMGGDVTAGYIVADGESLRDSMERVARKILNLAEGKTGKLIELAGRGK